ncbi:hypothetical protein KPL39_02120 [Clostridium gasigenes]|uniref:hypothetical protein n=1 Tax=Clostridium gasigenes TaxID=94869 RepID=UPI001C0E7FAC|nr:hypothetical protein [Clostridium gasigenes]MBU3135057.1 hypothetical protein [Clostridium gasigenes]
MKYIKTIIDFIITSYLEIMLVIGLISLGIGGFLINPIVGFYSIGFIFIGLSLLIAHFERREVK